MYKLLNAGFWRLKKNKIFWSLVIITISIAVFILSNNIINNFSGEKEGIDRLIISFINFIGFFIAMFTSLFVGTEYSDGSLRNKVIVGHSRINIYLSNLIISIVAGIFIEFVFMVVITIIGVPTLGGLQMTSFRFLNIIVNIIFIIVAYASIFNAISLLCSDITVSTVICMVLFLGMFICSMALSAIADTPEFIEDYDISGQTQSETPNPNYKGKLKTKIAKILCLIIPSGQAYQLTSLIENINLNELLIYSMSVIFITNAFGVYCFNKKDFK